MPHRAEQLAVKPKMVSGDYCHDTKNGDDDEIPHGWNFTKKAMGNGAKELSVAESGHH